MTDKTRGEQRFAGFTYSQIALWTGLKLSTVQSYGAKRRFDPHSMVETLQWIARQCRTGHRPAPWEFERLERPNNRVARELGFWCYRDYLKSDLWAEIRGRILPTSCYKCGANADQVHHTRYTAENMRGDNEGGLRPVCIPCHAPLHNGTDADWTHAEVDSSETAPTAAPSHSNYDPLTG